MKENSQFVRPWFQLILIILSFSIIIFTLVRRITIFHTYDTYPELTRFDPKTFERFGYFPEKVQVGFLVNQINKFDTVKNDFVFTGILWFSFNPGTISIDTLNKFDFRQAKILKRSPPTTKIVGDKIIVKYKLTVKFSSNLNYTDFPLDDHRINLMLVYPLISPQEIMLEAKVQNFDIETEAQVFGWDQVNKNAESGYLVARLDPFDSQKNAYYPAAFFSTDFSRYGIRYVIIILLPILFIFYLSLFSFSIIPRAGISLVAGGISGLISYRFVILPSFMIFLQFIYQ